MRKKINTPTPILWPFDRMLQWKSPQDYLDADLRTLLARLDWSNTDPAHPNSHLKLNLAMENCSHFFKGCDTHVFFY